MMDDRLQYLRGQDPQRPGGRESGPFASAAGPIGPFTTPETEQQEETGAGGSPGGPEYDSSHLLVKLTTRRRFPGG